MERADFLGNTIPGTSFNWSGVGWDNAGISNNVALISPTQFLYSAHSSLSGTLSFLGPSSGLFTTGHGGVTSIAGTDLAIGTLNAAAPADIVPFPIAIPTGDLDDLRDITLYVYGKGSTGASSSHRLGIDELGMHDGTNFLVENVAGRVTPLFVYERDTSIDYQVLLSSGASGGPTFVNVNGNLALMGIHAARQQLPGGGNWVNFDTFLPVLAADIAAAAPSANFVFFSPSVPEPSQALLLLFGLLGFVARRTR